MRISDLQEDWIKVKTWNLPKTWPAFIQSLGWDAASKRAHLVRLMALPVWRAAPPDIKRKAEDYLRGV